MEYGYLNHWILPSDGYLCIKSAGMQSKANIRIPLYFVLNLINPSLCGPHFYQVCPPAVGHCSPKFFPQLNLRRLHERNSSYYYEYVGESGGHALWRRRGHFNLLFQVMKPLAHASEARRRGGALSIGGGGKWRMSGRGGGDTAQIIYGSFVVCITFVLCRLFFKETIIYLFGITLDFIVWHKLRSRPRSAACFLH